MRRNQTVMWTVSLSIICLAGCGGKPIAAPTEFETWNSNEGAFRFDYPKGWDAKGGGKSAFQWARIESEGASIHVTVSIVDSLIGDIASIGDSFMGDEFGDFSDEYSAPAEVHAFNKESVLDGEGYRSFKEDEGASLSTRLGQGWRSEFTASRGLGRRVRGYRATILGTEYCVNVMIHCNASDWETLQPVFRELLDGFERGAVLN